jgi:hypothetical protein
MHFLQQWKKRKHTKKIVGLPISFDHETFLTTRSSKEPRHHIADDDWRRFLFNEGELLSKGRLSFDRLWAIDFFHYDHCGSRKRD